MESPLPRGLRALQNMPRLRRLTDLPADFRADEPAAVAAVVWQPEHGAAGFMPGTPSVQRQQYAAMGRGIGLRWHFYYPRVFPKRFHDKGKAGQIVVNLDEFARYVERVFF